MKKNITYIRLFSIIGICFLLVITLIILGGLFNTTRKEGYTNNGLDIYNNLSFGGRGSSGSDLYKNGYDDGVAEKWGYGWGDNNVKQFLNLQSNINPEYIFDVNTMQKYVNKNEAKDFLANSNWNWSDETKQKYLQYIGHDAISKEWVNPQFNMNILQTAYPESAIKKLLGDQGCGGVKRNQIGVFIADEDIGRLHEGQEKNGSGIRTFGVNSGLLSNGNYWYDLIG
jgi:hypothetical protein